MILTLALGSINFVNAQKKQQIKIFINRQKAIPGAKITIKFLSLLEDSRCPVNTNCITAGNARITIKVSKQNSAAQTFELGTNPATQSATFAGYQIKLINLNAGPVTNTGTNSDAYTATFSVTKVKN